MANVVFWKMTPIAGGKSKIMINFSYCLSPIFDQMMIESSRLYLEVFCLRRTVNGS
ncbi:hypothetical protein VB620_15885 [Nodularia harveyana UHCC-0300]|uniref:Uncharacterized protein n=1 Tax=Nodularia harveyana UHCC-0300 TaxID=2974287 RepID=A0ABU5UH20_9CYAN|nr:hypothetical protein [Nodularia harveyana]MEA5582815.1 hypothetical protein [Nodularia harveyana UHCC-0300]